MIQFGAWGKTLAMALLPKATQEWIHAQRERSADRRFFLQHLRRTDVFVVAHPKSGNTWLAYMLAILLHKDHDERIHLSNIGERIPTIHQLDREVARHTHLRDPRIFRNEAPSYPDLYPRTVYLMRDPRAALVSLYHMYRTIFGRETVTLEAFADEYLTYGCIRRWEPWLIRWDRQVRAWMKRAKRDPRVLIVRYEEMVKDRQTALERVADFAGIPYSSEDLALAVRRGSFEAMREDEERFGAESYTKEESKRGRFVRRGKADGWKEEIEDRLIKRIERELGPTMKQAGYL